MNRQDEDFKIAENDDFASLYVKDDRIKEMLEDRLKKSSFGGYSKASVEQLALELTESSEQMKANFEKQIRDLSTECSRLSSECSILREQIKQAEDEKKDVESALNSVRQEKDELSAKMEEGNGDDELQKNKIRSLEEELNEKELQLEKYKNIIDRLQEQLQAAADETKHLNQEITRLQEQAENTGRYVPEVKAESALAEEAKAQITETEEKYTALYEQFMESIGRNEQLIAEKNAIEKLLKKYQVREQELVILRDENADLRSCISEFKNTMDSMIQEMEQQSELYQKVNEQLEERKAEIGRLNSQKVELQMKNVQLLERMESISRVQTAAAEKQIFLNEGMKEIKQEPNENKNVLSLPSRNRMVTISKTDAEGLLNRAKKLTEDYTA